MDYSGVGFTSKKRRSGQSDLCHLLHPAPIPRTNLDGPIRRVALLDFQSRDDAAAITTFNSSKEENPEQEYPVRVRSLLANRHDRIAILSTLCRNWKPKPEKRPQTIGFVLSHERLARVGQARNFMWLPQVDWY